MHCLSSVGIGTAVSAEEETALIESARGDPAAFAGLYRRYVASVYRYLYSRVGNVLDAEDLTAQVFTEALEGLPRYRHQGNFAAWLFTIARRRVTDHYRRRRVYLPLDETLDCPDQGNDPLACLVREESLQRLAVLVGRLDREQQELLRLRFAAGLSYAAMARVLRRTEAAVKMAVRRLLRRLETEWEESNG